MRWTLTASMSEKGTPKTRRIEAEIDCVRLDHDPLDQRSVAVPAFRRSHFGELVGRLEQLPSPSRIVIWNRCGVEQFAFARE